MRAAGCGARDRSALAESKRVYSLIRPDSLESQLGVRDAALADIQFAAVVWLERPGVSSVSRVHPEGSPARVSASSRAGRGCGEALGGGGRVSGASRARRRLPPLGFPRPEASRSIVFVTARVPHSIRRASWLHRGLVVSRVDGPPPPRGRPRADPGGGFPRRRLGRARGDAGDARARVPRGPRERVPRRVRSNAPIGRGGPRDEDERRLRLVPAGDDRASPRPHRGPPRGVRRVRRARRRPGPRARARARPRVGVGARGRRGVRARGPVGVPPVRLAARDERRAEAPRSRRDAPIRRRRRNLRRGRRRGVATRHPRGRRARNPRRGRRAPRAVRRRREGQHDGAVRGAVSRGVDARKR